MYNDAINMPLKMLQIMMIQYVCINLHREKNFAFLNVRFSPTQDLIVKICIMEYVLHIHAQQDLLSRMLLHITKIFAYHKQGF